MNRLGWVGWALLLLLPPAAMAVPQPQVLDDFGQAAWDGRPNGWSALGMGATAKVTHQAGEDGSMKVEYNFASPQGGIYLLTRARLRGEPFNLELTVKGTGKELLGILVEEAISGTIHELRSSDPLAEAGWVTRAIEPKQAGLKFATLPGGGGLRMLGLTLRQGPGGSASGSIEVSEIVAACEVTAEQAAMVDIFCGRADGIFAPGEDPKPELMVTAVSGERQDFQVSYTVTDGDGNRVGQGNETAQIGPGRAKRFPVSYSPRGPYGFFKVEATARAGASERHATARFCRVPAVPEGDGRQIGAAWRPDPAVPWQDVQLLTALRRAGVGAVRVELSWQDTERSRGQRSWQAFDQVLATAKQANMPLLVAVVDPPGWAISAGRTELGTPLAAFVTEAAGRAGDQAMGWELLQEPNNARFWPPEPQPFAYRQLVATVRQSLQAQRPNAVVVNGALRGLEHGFAGSLITGSDDPIDHLGLSTPPPMRAFPFLDEDRPSVGLAATLADYRQWLKDTGRPYIAPWLIKIGVRTSPIEESKQGQAAELARAALLASAGGGKLFWHTAKDGDDTDDRYGLMRRNLEPKPAVAALAAVASKTYGAKFLGSPASRRDPVFVFSSSGGFIAAGWSDSGTGTLSVTGEVEGFNGWANPTGTSVSLGNLPGFLVGKGVTALLAAR